MPCGPPNQILGGLGIVTRRGLKGINARVSSGERMDGEYVEKG
jgi:hypothetical protein